MDEPILTLETILQHLEMHNAIQIKDKDLVEHILEEFGIFIDEPLFPETEFDSLMGEAE